MAQPHPEPLAIIAGVNAVCESIRALDNRPADGSPCCMTGALQRSGLAPADIDEVVFGNVAGPPRRPTSVG